VVPRVYDGLKAKLETERERLAGEICQLSSRGDERPGYGNHMADDATGVFEQTYNLSLRESLEGSLRLVDDALSRVEDGTYGTCAGCGGIIEWGRLKTLPYTGLCVECVRRLERAS
jgi:RNA polymerase-binding transcription factor DksA